MAMRATKELLKHVKENDRRIVAMTFYTQSKSKCEMIGSVSVKNVPKVLKLWTAILKLSREK